MFRRLAFASALLVESSSPWTVGPSPSRGRACALAPKKRGRGVGSRQSLGPRTRTAASTPTEAAHLTELTSAQAVDQAAWGSPEFWSQAAAAIPGLDSDDPAYARLRGFARNLRSAAPGERVTLPTGQEVLKQYLYPGLQPEDDGGDCGGGGVPRAPFLDGGAFAEVGAWASWLEQEVAPLARAELAQCLRPDRAPLLRDDSQAEPERLADAAAGTWERAAW